VERWEKEGMETTLLKKRRRRKKQNNSIQDSVGNKENGYPNPDLNKTMINVTKKPSDIHIKILKEEIVEDITEEFMEKILDMVNQNI
jgi:hypothetical protein